MAGENIIGRGTNEGLILNIRIETDLVVWTSGLNMEEIRKAINRGINYATARAKTRMKRSVVAEYNLKSSLVESRDLIRRPSTVGTLTGYVYGSTIPESLGHFNPTWYRDVFGNKNGGGYIKVSKRGAGYASKKSRVNTERSGVYFSVVKGKTEHLPGAFLYFSGSTPIVMARGHYDKQAGTASKSSGFKFTKPRQPITKMFTKSVYWGVLHPKTVALWEPETELDYMNELKRQCEVILKMR